MASGRGKAGAQAGLACDNFVSSSRRRFQPLRNFRFLLLLPLILLGVSSGCHAQAPQKALSDSDKALERRIEIMVRSQMNIPAEYKITIGARTKSDFLGYETLPVTFSRGTASKTLDYLISKDNKTLIRMDKIDLSKDPTQLVSTAERPFRGGADAKVTIVNFDDLECPYCARMHKELFPETIARYGDKVKIVYKDYPLVEMHPWAMHAAVDANCLAAQNGNAYWSYVDYVHDHGQEISSGAKSVDGANQQLDKFAMDEGKKQKLDEAKLQACVTAQDTSAVKASMKEGDSLGVDATPTLYINGERISGAEGTDVLWPVIDRALSDVGVPPPAAAPAVGGATQKPQGQ
jgi:protein-disulfide isomerase